MKEIPLTKGLVTKVDDDDYEWLMKYKWYAHDSRTGIYAARGKKVHGRVKTIYMHREIMNCPQGKEVDHQNDDALDNRKSNLEVVTKRRNVIRGWMNKKKASNKDLSE